MAALQCCADFGCTRARMSYVYTRTPPTWSSVPPSSVSRELGAESPVLCSISTLAACLTHGGAGVSKPLSRHPHPLLPPVSTSPLSTSASLFLPCK